MEISPQVVKSIRESDGDIGILFSFDHKLFMVEERVVDGSCPNEINIVNQSFFDNEDEAQQAFNSLAGAFVRDYIELASQINTDRIPCNNYGVLYLIERGKKTVLLVS